MTQKQLANLVFHERSAICRIEKGKQDPGILIYSIARALNCTANTFDPYDPRILNIPKTLEERLKP